MLNSKKAVNKKHKRNKIGEKCKHTYTKILAGLIVAEGIR